MVCGCSCHALLLLCPPNTGLLWVVWMFPQAHGVSLLSSVYLRGRFGDWCVLGWLNHFSWKWNAVKKLLFVDCLEWFLIFWMCTGEKIHLLWPINALNLLLYCRVSPLAVNVGSSLPAPILHSLLITRREAGCSAVMFALPPRQICSTSFFSFFLLLFFF